MRGWWYRLLIRMRVLHSPSLELLGKCWCQRKDPKLDWGDWTWSG